MRAFVKDIIEKGDAWTDPDFKPQLSSMFDKDIDEGSDS
jgi:hypothetical protein